MCARPANPELRSEILKAATRIVEECGPDCVTMRQVAEEVGYSPTTLYLYFKDKETILGEVIVQGFEELADFSSMAEVGPSMTDRFRQRARAYIVWAVMHPGLYSLMLETRVTTDWDADQVARVSRSANDGWRALDDAIKAGELTGIDDPAGFGVAVWAATHGVASLANSRRLSPTAAVAKPSELVEEATALGDELVNGLLAPHVARPKASGRARARSAGGARV